MLLLKHIPAPVSKSDHLQFLTTSLDHSDFLGPIAIGRVFSGEIRWVTGYLLQRYLCK